MALTWKKQADSEEFLTNLLHPTVKKWFFQTFEAFSPAQLHGVSLVHSRQNMLLCAPTGSSKTLTAFLAILNELVGLDDADILENQVYAIYISPLKALNYDIAYNLEHPLSEMSKLSKKPLNIRVAARTGDTTPYARAKMNDKPPHILVTTPESLGLLLVSPKFREHIKKVQWVIVDEIHAIAENKRGVHLSLLLEQLHLLGANPTRIGLSATAAPLESIAQFLVGTKRDCTLVNIAQSKTLKLEVQTPVPDFFDTTQNEVWTQSLDLIHKHIQSHTSTLVFTNTRAATEKIVYALKEKYPSQYYEINENPPFERSQLIGAHHGSLSAEHRSLMEQRLRDGKMKCIVCSTSLELGIDIGFVDLVILLGSPKAVSRLLQRVGRSGHKLHAQPHGILIAQDNDDLIECLALRENAVLGKIDELQIPNSCYDILSQWIIGCSLFEPHNTTSHLFEIARQSYCYKDLQFADFMKCISYLSEEYESLSRLHAYPKIRLQDDLIVPQSKTVAEIYRTNAGTISDSGAIAVKRGDAYLGSIDEDFMELLRPGDVFVLGGETYKFVRANGMTVQVVDSHHRGPTVPRWRSQALSLTYGAAKAIAAFRQNIPTSGDSAMQQANTYIRSQAEFLKVPKTSELLVEQFEFNQQWQTVIHSVIGRRANHALSLIVEYAAVKTHKSAMTSIVTDTGICITSSMKLDIEAILKRIPADESQKILANTLDGSEQVRRRFRQSAVRGMLILRRFRTHVKRVGRQQVSSQMLFSAVRSIDPNFILVAEALREVMHDAMDVDAAKVTLKKIANQELSILIHEVKIPSPFATSIVLAQLSDVLSAAESQEYMVQLNRMRTAYKEMSVQEKKATKELVGPNFSYQEYWQEPKQKTKPVESLQDQAKRALKKADVEPEFAFQLLRLLDGETTGYHPKFVKWANQLVTGTTPKIWSDQVVKEIRARLSHINS
ncbi:MAG TPA: ATP-dependent helicase [Acidobacteriota bacterium]|nr:ATP-dependent helicase [Acidobacteriota bacterium]